MCMKKIGIKQSMVYFVMEYSVALQKNGIFTDMKISPQYKCWEQNIFAKQHAWYDAIYVKWEDRNDVH